MLFAKNIWVKYSYKTVLKGITTKFCDKTIYSILGENGAGKSTFAHVLCGDIKSSEGTILIDNKEVHFSSPKDAIENGIICVHQRPLLSTSISIKENLKLGLKNFDEKKAIELLDLWLPDIKSNTLVKNLTLQNHFFVSLVGALLKNPKVLILDEPPLLSPVKLKFLSKDITIIIITHNLKEALQLSDKILLLKNGTIIQEKNSSEITYEQIKDILFADSNNNLQKDNISDELEDLKLPDFIEKSNITEEQILSIHNFNKEKIGYIPSDKTFRASNPNLTILQLLTAYNPKGKKEELEQYASMILKNADVNIKLNEKAKCLSGGMLQRLILEKEIMQKPQKLYLFNPTKGLDLEATRHLYNKLESLYKNGTKIIIGEVE